MDQRSSRRMKLKIKTSLQISNCQERVSKPSSLIDSKEISCDFSLDSIDSNECDNDTNCPITPTTGISLRSRFIEVEYGNENEHQSQTKYNSVKMYELAKIADRYNVSDRVAAAIATAALIDFKLILPDNNLFVIDKNKVRRSREKIREEQTNNLSFEGIQALYFDGRNDDTLKKTENKALKTTKEEHISFVQQPCSYFIGHKSISNKKGVTMSNCIQNFVGEKEICERDIKAVGCDGTVANTGHKTGAIRLLEVSWKRPLQWIICMLHMLELPLRALVTHLDGPTTGPNSYSGPFGEKNESVSRYCYL